MTTTLSMPGKIRTQSGLYVDLLDPTPEMIRIEDIAHALANECRFGGHTNRHYSVAEHSILCAVFVDNEADRFCALMHDATEAYLKDLPKPLKMLPEMNFYNQLETLWWNVIAHKFGLPEEIPQAVKRVDKRMLITEQRDLMGRKPNPAGDGYEPLSMHLPRACGGDKEAFMDQFLLLANDIAMEAIRG